MTRLRQMGEAMFQQRMDGGAVKLSTFIPLQIRKRGVRKAVIRPDEESAGKHHAGPVRQPHNGGAGAGFLLATATRRRRDGQWHRHCLS